MLIVDTPHFNWVDPTAAEEWNNLVLVVYWKISEKAFKVKASLFYKKLTEVYRACLCFYVANKAYKHKISIPFS